ncbi:calcium-independent phospholipase A2-gamma [Rhizoctonia solani 123E]|uniref:Calcium-independent phospholipase A2-gamma n=1 Tax=Rhizoctonia solani 123E TaxID=1423351 RepID=A0A074SZ40_9AGAM|nr:calcium-independent phospholipase A2-gamma [Rhizoctonia solani 123E]
MSNEDESRGLNILCIDGGGARGLSSLIILREIMNRLNGLGDGYGELKPADCFDVIAGSGTGGLSACMLGRLRMPLDPAIQEYAKLIQGVFADKKIIRTSGPSAYKGTKLREVLQQIVGKVGKDGEMMEEIGNPEGCKTIIFAMSKHNINAALPSMFRSYRVVANRGPDCTILDALCATMAHPNLFKDIEIKEGALRQSFVSGDLGCSNPMAHVLTEVKRVYPGRHVSCILSIGAGHARTINIPDHGIPEQIFRTQDLAAMKDMATDSERVAEEMAIRFGATNRVYFRFNVDQGIQDIKAGDWERLHDVMAHAKAYLVKIDTDQRMEDLVQAIRKQSNSLEVELIDGQVQHRLRVRCSPRLKRCPAPTSVYTGRKDEAKQVIGCLLENGNERPICVIYGLGGSGKTQLALKVVEQTRNNWIEVLYIDGTSRETIESALEAFAGVKTIGHTYQDSIDWLESCLGRWLIVFDNVDEPSIGASLRRYIPAGTYGSVLITTRLTDLAFLARGTGSVCRMSPGMKPEESLALLTKVARLLDQRLPESEIKAAIALMEDFGHLALAIVHAGAYIAHSPGLTISRYRAFFHAQRRRMLEEYSKLKVPVDDYTKTVYTTWEMCYSLLKQDTRPMLWLIAFLHHDSITEEIFERATINTQNPLTRVSLLPPTEITTTAYHHVDKYLRQFLDPISGWDSLQFLSVINEVVSYSLVDFDRMNGAYSIHVLVQDWAKTKVEQEQGLALECTATLLSLSIGFESSDDSPGSKEFMASLEMHLDCFLANKQATARDYHRQFAKVYRELKRWQQVEDLETKVYQEMSRALGEKHMYTLGCMIDLASTYLTRDLLDKAEELQRKALDTQRELLGQDHPHTQRSITNLTSIYLKQGRWDEAEKVQLQGLKSNAQLQPQNFKEHLDTISAMLNLISTYCQQNRWDESTKLCLRVVELQTKMSGEADLDTVKSMAKLAFIYAKQGQWGKAEPFQQHVVNLYKQTFGPGHLDTLKAMAELAVIHSKQDDWAKAEIIQQHVVNLYRQNMGPEHLDTLKATSKLAVIHSKQGVWAEAEALQRRVVRSYERTLGIMSPDTLQAKAQLAAILSKQGHWAEAASLQEDVLRVYAEAPPTAHRDMVAIIAGLAVTNSRNGPRHEVVTLLNRSWGRCKHAMDKKKQGNQISVAKYGVLNLGRGRLAKEMEVRERILNLNVQLLGEYSLDTESDLEISVVILAYLEIYVWLLRHPKPSGLGILGFSYTILWAYFAHSSQPTEAASPGWASYLCEGYYETPLSMCGVLVVCATIMLHYARYMLMVPVLCDDEIYRPIAESDICPGRNFQARKKRVGVLSAGAGITKDVPVTNEYEAMSDTRTSVHTDIGTAKGSVSDNNIFDIPVIGVLRVTILNAHIRMGDEIGRHHTLNPYTNITINGRSETTRATGVECAHNVHWGEVMFLVVDSHTETVNLTVLNHRHHYKDTELGTASFEFSTLTQEELVRKVLKDGKEQGEVKFDTSFFPILNPQTLDDSKVQPLPETEVGIVCLVIHQAKGLDDHKHMFLSEYLSPFARLLIRNREIHETDVKDYTYNPVWESPKKFLVTDKSFTVVTVKIIDRLSRSKDPVVGFVNIRLKDLLAAREKQQDWFPLSGCTHGKVRISADWKPLNMAISIQGAGSYSPPIGIIRIWIKCVKDVKNVEATLGGKSDAYVRVMLNAVTMARIEVNNNNLNPEWDQLVYVPVHGLRETLYLECMDYQNITDRSLEIVELTVAGLARQTEDERVPYEGTGKRDVANPIRLGKRQTECELHFTAEFIPAIALQGVSFQSVDDTQRATDRFRGQLAATNTEKSELRDEISPDEHKAEGVQMSTEELLNNQSGVLVFNIIEGQIFKKARLEVLLDDGHWPVFATEKRNSQAHWDQVGEGFIKELDFARVWLRLNENDEGEKEDIIADLKLDAKQFLEEALAGPATFKLSGQDGKNASTVRIQAKYVPVEIKLDPRESINNMGVLHVELVDGRAIHGADRSGKSDPFVVFNLNGSKVFKSQTKKKTLAPEWKESFDISIPSRVGADFSLEVFDWNQGEAAKSLGSGQIELADLAPFEVTVREIALSSAKHGEKGIVQIRMVFRPEIITKFYATAGPAMTEVGGVHLGAGRAMGRKTSGRDKDSSEELHEVPPFAPDTEADAAADGNGATNGSVGPASGLAVKPPPLPIPGPGALKVTLHRAKGLAGIEEGDVAKPYVIMKIGDKDHKSSHVKSNTPEWNESFTFPNTSKNMEILHVTIVDKSRYGRDRILAEGTIDIWQHIQPLFTPPILSKEISALLKDNSGMLHLRLDFEPMQNTSIHMISTSDESSLVASKKTLPRSRLGFNHRWREEAKTPSTPNTNLGS